MNFKIFFALFAGLSIGVTFLNIPPGMKTLIDQRNLITDHLSTTAITTISGLVKSLREKLGNGNCALVMSEPVGINMAKMWKLITQADVDFQISVCNSIEQAVSWLKKGY